MVFFLLLLAVTTGIYLVLATVWDIKSREIYTFPCNVLTVLWLAYTFFRGNVDVKVMALYIGFIIALYTLFNLTHIWGAGDSDLLLLFGSVYLAHMKVAFTLLDVCKLCIALVLVLLLSMGIGFVEAGEIILPLQPKDQNKNHNHVGLNNAHHIIELMSGENYGIRVFSTPGAGSKICIRIPFDDGKQEITGNDL